MPLKIAGTVLVHAMFLLVGLVVGTFLFLPWETVWGKALAEADARTPGLSISWSDIPEAQANELRIKDLRLKAARGQVSVPELFLRLGVSPLTRLRILSGGQALEAMLNLDRHLLLRGGLDLGALVAGGKVGGVVKVSGDLAFPGWKSPWPHAGRLDISAQDLTVMQSMQVKNFSLLAEMEGDILHIRSFSLEQPVALQGQGEVRLNRQDPLSSTYTLHGTVRFGDSRQNFTRQGNFRQGVAGLL